MDIKYIKVGKWYNVPFKVVEIKSGDIHMENGGIKAVCQPSELSEITTRQDVRTEHSTVGTICEGADHLPWKYRPLLFSDDDLKYAADYFKAMSNHIKSITPDTENGIKNTETAPKYDPNREFRKGDKVKAVLRYGRIPNDGVPKDVILEVIEDERDGIVKVLHKMGIILDIFNVYALYLELVAPVEELEPYYVEDGGLSVMVNSRINERVVCCAFHKNVHPHAKAAAEAECARLNEEYRKEQE